MKVVYCRETEVTGALTAGLGGPVRREFPAKRVLQASVVLDTRVTMVCVDHPACPVYPGSKETEDHPV